MAVAIVRFLRSRKVAVALLVGVTAYLCISTAVPLESVDAARAAAWQQRYPGLAQVARSLGLMRAFTSPVFLLAALWLTVSTAMCAWDRSARATGTWRSWGHVTPAVAGATRRSPTARLEVAGDERAAADDVERELASMRLRVRRVSGTVGASSGAVGLLGSPLFHWALVGAFVFAGLGALTRYEGFANILVGRSIVDAGSAYDAGYSAGPLAGRTSSGLRIGVAEVSPAYVAEGIDRDITPRIRVTVPGGRDAVEQWVYPNHPFRQGSVTVHRAKAGPALVGEVRSPSSSEVETVTLYYARIGFDESASFRVRAPTSGELLTVSVTPRAGQKVSVLATRMDGSSAVTTQVVGVGEAATLGEDLTFTPTELTGYAQLKVVRDWALPWVFSMFAAGIAGLALALFVPPRQVYVDVESTEDGCSEASRSVLRIFVRTANSDPAFAGAVVRRLQTALGAVEVPASGDTEETNR